MKMSKEKYNHILKRFKENEHTIIEALPVYENNKEYKNYKKALAWTCLRVFVDRENGIRTEFIVTLYDEGLNDNHISTGAMKALNEIIKGND